MTIGELIFILEKEDPSLEIICDYDNPPLPRQTYEVMRLFVPKGENIAILNLMEH